jgi:hypothetical protein
MGTLQNNQSPRVLLELRDLRVCACKMSDQYPLTAGRVLHQEWQRRCLETIRRGRR